MCDSQSAGLISERPIHEVSKIDTPVARARASSMGANEGLGAALRKEWSVSPRHKAETPIRKTIAREGKTKDRPRTNGGAASNVTLSSTAVAASSVTFLRLTIE
jgi:hypothetical protein